MGQIDNVNNAIFVEYEGNEFQRSFRSWPYSSVKAILSVFWPRDILVRDDPSSITDCGRVSLRTMGSGHQ